MKFLLTVLMYIALRAIVAFVYHALGIELNVADYFVGFWVGVIYVFFSRFIYEGD